MLVLCVCRKGCAGWNIEAFIFQFHFHSAFYSDQEIGSRLNYLKILGGGIKTKIYQYLHIELRLFVIG